MKSVYNIYCLIDSNPTLRLSENRLSINKENDNEFNSCHSDCLYKITSINSLDDQESLYKYNSNNK